MDQNIADILETVTFIKGKIEKVDERLESMPTTNEVRQIVLEASNEKLKPITDELSTMRQSLEEISNTTDNLSGLPKEIDHSLERITTIEKHLGLTIPKHAEV
jgi:predicted nuclease with TOPRIM domain